MQKAAARKAAFERRKAAKTAQADALAAAMMLGEIKALKPRVLAGYLPIRTEVDPRPAMAAMAEICAVCVPVIQGTGQPLLFRQWHPDCTLIDGPFGAQVPADGAWLVPDVLIVPLVAFDTHGGRLGYGGGFYDRTLEQLRKTGAVTAIGFAFAAQKAQTLPMEPTDQRLDMIVTDKGVVRP